MILAIIISLVILSILVALCVVVWYMIIPDLIKSGKRFNKLKQFFESKYGRIIYYCLGVIFCAICMIGALRLVLKMLIISLLYLFL